MSAQERRRQEHRRNDVQLLGKTIYFFTTEDVVEAPGYVIARCAPRWRSPHDDAAL